MKYKAIIFDLDGTLLNSLEDIADATNRVLAAEGFPVYPTEKYREFVGYGAKELIVRVLPPNYCDACTHILSTMAGTGILKPDLIPESLRCWICWRRKDSN
jgi:phosphoglycolate phosphatase